MCSHAPHTQSESGLLMLPGTHVLAVLQHRLGVALSSANWSFITFTLCMALTKSMYWSRQPIMASRMALMPCHHCLAMSELVGRGEQLHSFAAQRLIILVLCRCCT